MIKLFKEQYVSLPESKHNRFIHTYYFSSVYNYYYIIIVGGRGCKLCARDQYFPLF